MHILLVLAACTAKESAGTEEENGAANEKKAEGEKILQLNNGEEPTSFDPAIGFDNVSWNALNNLMEGLTRLGEDHTPQPAVAEEWEVSEDGTTYTFQLREDANWSNGDPVVAEDFIYAWERLLNPEWANLMPGTEIETGTTIVRFQAQDMLEAYQAV